MRARQVRLGLKALGTPMVHGLVLCRTNLCHHGADRRSLAPPHLDRRLRARKLAKRCRNSSILTITRTVRKMRCRRRRLECRTGASENAGLSC